jgi:pimeloyl-ACP methyl ester carboxylesterase
MEAVLYVHGRGGSAAEAEHYRPLFPGYDVTGLDYRGSEPWTAGPEIREAVLKLKEDHGAVELIANSIGAWFCMCAGVGGMIRRAYFISPVTDMERLIRGMMAAEDVTERELEEKKTVHTASGDVLSWEYLSYVREHPVIWNAPTEILYGRRDTLVPFAAVSEFAGKHGCALTVMEDGEHWFHTEEQMRFLDGWITGGRCR